MTFTEYNTQIDPQRHPVVDVLPEECVNIFKVHDGEVVQLRTWGQLYQYLVPTGEDRLYTMDKDGNKYMMSVFKLKR